MAYQAEQGKYISTEGKRSVAYYIYTPQDVPAKAIVQISHGMCEYVNRYIPFIEFMTANGFIVCGNDHLGHGNSIEKEDDLGYFTEQNGWQTLRDDLYKTTELVKEKYPDIPYILFGHSMGSFVARAYLEKYGNKINGAIICGTSGKVGAAAAGIALTKLIAKVKGNNYRSNFIKNIAFGQYNKQIKDLRTDRDWLTRVPEVVDTYLKDPKCNFCFTTNGFINLFGVLSHVSKDAWFDAVPKNLPIYLIAGEADPVGQYGKGVQQVYDRLKQRGINDISIKLYPDARHEILNEINKNEVSDDIIQWINSVL